MKDRRVSPLSHLFDSAASALDAFDDGALVDVLAVADLSVKRDLLQRHAFGRRADIEQQPDSLLGQRRVGLERMQQGGRLAAIAKQDTAHQPAIADNQLLVSTAPRLGKLHHLVALLARLFQSHRG